MRSAHTRPGHHPHSGSPARDTQASPLNYQTGEPVVTWVGVARGQMVTSHTDRSAKPSCSVGNPVPLCHRAAICRETINPRRPVNVAAPKTATMPTASRPMAPASRAQ